MSFGGGGETCYREAETQRPWIHTTSSLDYVFIILLLSKICCQKRKPTKELTNLTKTVQETK